MNKRSKIVFFIKASFLLMLFYPGIVLSQNTLTGMVLDIYGYPIVGVEIKSNDKVSFTNDQGIFSAESSDFIFVSKNGYKSQTHANPKELMIVVLKEDDLHTSINSFFIARNKFEISESVSSIKGDELSDSYTTNIGNTLFGKLTGLTLAPSGGEPGNDHPEYYVRGVGTLNNSSPLIFIDGFEAPIDFLKAEEIESISVLKDAAALAPFGIKGANGVIWVTTKRGKIGNNKISISYKSGLQSPIRIPSFLGAYDYSILYNEARSNDNNEWNPFYTNQQLDAYKNGNDGTIENYNLLYPNVNWYDEVLKRNAPMSNTDISYSGGNKNIRYFLSTGYQHTEGLYKDTDKKKKTNSNLDYSKFNVRTNVDADISKILSMSVQFGGVIENQYTPSSTSNGIWNNMARYPANAFPVMTPEGWGGTGLHPDNPKATILQKGYRHFHNRSLQTTLTLEQNLNFITPGLRLYETFSLYNYKGSYYYKYRDYQRFQPFLSGDSIDYIVTGNQDTEFTITQTGTSRNTQNQRQNVHIGITYDKTYGVHNTHASLIYHSDEYLIDGNNLPFITRGFAGKLMYDYKQKYYTQLSYAINGTGDYPKNKNIGVFPALSLGWILSKEEFLKRNKNINFLKFRGSIGLTGNNDLANQRFAYEQYYRSSNSQTKFGWDGTASAAMLYEYTIANRDITWEKGLKSNIGLESRLFSNLDIELDVFYEKRHDIIVSQHELAYLGFLTGKSNDGIVSNRGLEFNVKWSEQLGKLNYYLQSTFSYAKNRIENMNELPRSEDYMRRTGHSINQPFALEAAGLFHSWDEINDPSTPIHTFAEVQPGDIRYIDQNNDGYIDENDIIALTDFYSTLPEINYALFVGFDYGDIDFNIAGYGVGNRSVYLNGINNWAFQNNGNASEWALERWAYYPEQGIDTRANATYPRLSLGSNNNNWRNSSFWIRNAAYFRLGEISIGYTLPQKITSKISINKLRVYAMATNLFTIDSIKNVDPAVMTGYPFMKSCNLGLNINF